MPPGSIVIKNNPVTKWEFFHKTLWIDRDDFSHYVDDDRSMGGFWSCTFRMYGMENELSDFFANGLGRNVEVFGYGLETLFEGFVFEMVYNFPPDQYEISLANVLNKIWMRADYDGDNEVERSTFLQNTESQGKYGVIEHVISGGELEGLSVADQASQTYINLRAFPRPYVKRGAGRGDPYLELFCKGYIETLSWLTYNQTAISGTQGLSSEFQDIIANAPFVASTEIESNSTPVTKEYDADRRILDIIFDLARLGDANNNRWLIYMTKGRKIHLVQAAPEVAGD